MRFGAVAVCGLALIAARPARAQEPDSEAPEGFVLPETSVDVPPLVILGYVDVGFAKAQGDGTSFAPGDPRPEPDYHVDPFAPAVNARGEVASTDAGGKAVNGFLPRSVNIGG